MNDAIRIAVEKGGYKGFNTWYDNPKMEVFYEHGICGTRLGHHQDTKLPEELILDPLFWKALARALSWEQYTEEDIGNWDEVNTMITRTEVTWKKKAHQYFDLLLTGGDVEKFWKELLKEAN